MTTATPSTMANAIRALAMDAVQKANSGHPGAPMGMAEMAVIARVMNDAIENRDDESKLAQLAKEIAELCSKFPIYR